MEKSLQTYVENVKGLIFDYGGTLDTGGEHWSWVIWRAWQHAGVETTLPVFREAYVYAERELARVRHIMPQHDFQDLLTIKIRIELNWLSEQGQFPPELIDEKTEKISRECNDFAKSHIEDSANVLKELKEKYPMVLVSNFYGNIDTVLQKYGIRQYFDKIIESSVVGIRKPDPGIFSLGVKALEQPASDVMVIGDSYRKDIVPALEAGCKAVWIKGPGWTGEKDMQEYPYIIQNLQELAKFLK